MKKIPFLILLTFCFTSLFGGFFYAKPSLPSNAYAEAVASGTTIKTASELENFVLNYDENYASAFVELEDVQGDEPLVYDMSGITLTKSLGDDQNPFCGTFDGRGHTIANLTIDLSEFADQEEVYAGFFGKLGQGAKVQNVNFQNLTIIAPNASKTFAGIVAYASESEISNIRLLQNNTNSVGIDIQSKNSSSSFVGAIVGFASHTKIVGLQIEENILFELGKSDVNYVGGAIGKAENSSIKNVQISSSSSNETLSVNILGEAVDPNQQQEFDFFGNVNFGGVVGSLEDSDMTNFICRIDNFGSTWQVSRNDLKTHNFGGAVAVLSNSKIIFGVIKTNFDLQIENTFVGTISLGGIVGRTSQRESVITNIGIKNSFNIQNYADETAITIGEVAGDISSPAPKASNISYIRFKKNAEVERFGNMGNYNFADPSTYDSILENDGRFDLDKLPTEGEISYFSEGWNLLCGPWDFSDTWYVSSQNIFLQNFYESYTVSVIDVDKRALNFEGIDGLGKDTTSLDVSYGQKVTLRFSFKPNMSKFYSLSTLQFKRKDVAHFSKVGNEYRLVHKSYSINMNENGNGFEIIINRISHATAGEYAVTIENAPFYANLSTRLYDKQKNADGVEEDILNTKVENPGQLQLIDKDGNPGIPRDKMTEFNLIEGEEYRFRALEKTATADGEIYAPTKEWYLVTSSEVDENGNTKETIQQIPDEFIKDGMLVFTFGDGIFSDNLTIFAKFTSKSCVGIFKFDDGVKRIELGSGSIVVNNSGERKPISKEDPKLGLDIYISKEYDFDQTRFIDKLGYKSVVEGKDFCKFLNQEEVDDLICYHFILDMTSLNWANVEINNIFSVQVETVKIDAQNNSWIWWVVGGVGGALLLAGIIVLIVWLIRRNRFGGSVGKPKYNKKNYKNMYY